MSQPQPYQPQPGPRDWQPPPFSQQAGYQHPYQQAGYYPQPTCWPPCPRCGAPAEAHIVAGQCPWPARERQQVVRQQYSEVPAVGPVHVWCVPIISGCFTGIGRIRMPWAFGGCLFLLFIYFMFVWIPVMIYLIVISLFIAANVLTAVWEIIVLWPIRIIGGRTAEGSRPRRAL